MNAFITLGGGESFYFLKRGYGRSGGSNCVPECNSDFIFLVSDLDQGTAGSESLQSLL